MNRHPGESRGPGSFKNLDSGFRRNDERRISNTLFMDKTTDIVSGGAWGRRPHTFGEATWLLSYDDLL
jgi:hypothetical protein